MRRNHTIQALLTTAIAAVVLAACTPPAPAPNEAAFQAAIEPAFVNPDHADQLEPDMLDAGYAICDMDAAGATDAQLVTSVAALSVEGVFAPKMPLLLVTSALTHLCTESTP